MILGVDPGKKTALALIDNNKVIDTLHIEHYNLKIRDFINKLKEGTFIAIERVHSLPMDGKRSSFTFGYSFGYIMSLIHYKFPFVLIEPSVWHKKLRIHSKQESINRVYEKFIYTTKNHNIADAILIAEYGMRVIKDGRY